MSDQSLETRAGRQLYDLLPEVYRSRDDGSLAAWLDSAGNLLDLVRNTMEQRLADSFPDEPLDGRACQDWLLPYFADLLEPQLISVDPRGQRAEVANAIAWRQRKGTLVSAEQVAQEVGQLEAEVQEGWKRVAVTPRLGSGRPAAPPAAGQPFAAELPLGTVDFGFQSRAFEVDANDPAAHLTRFGDRTLPWRQAYASGAPAFPGSYEDASARTVDLRAPDWRRGHAHPRRLLFYYPPQGGFFPPGAPRVDWDLWLSLRGELEAQCGFLLASGAERRSYVDSLNRAISLVRLPLAQGALRIEARQGDDLVGERIAEADGRVRLRILRAGRWLEKVTQAGEPTVYRAGEPVVITTAAANNTIFLSPPEFRVDFEGLSFDAVLRCPSEGHRLRFRNAAAREVYVFTKDTAEPVIDAVDSLFDSVLAPSGLIRLEYVTILEALGGERLQVSDSLIARQQPGITSQQKVSVIRYSRTPLPLVEGTGLLAAFNTTEPPLFVELDFLAGGQDGSQTVRRPAKFGEPGSGVLHPEAPRALRLGSEDGGEMGAYHGRRYSQAAEAVRSKLEDYLPIGLEAVLIPDPLLLTPPPALAG